MADPSATSHSSGGAFGPKGWRQNCLMLHSMFPFHWGINARLELVQIGDGLRRLYPKLRCGCFLADFFRLRGLSGPLTFEAIAQNGETFRFESLQDGLQFQGQMLVQADKELLFLGCPQLTHEDALRSLERGFSHNRDHESVTELLFLLQARSASLSETRQLAEQLTEQRLELHRALHHAELVTAVLEQAADAIEITDVDLKLVYVNTAFEQMTGYSRQEVLGKTPAELFRSGQHDDAFYEEIWQTVQQREVWEGVYLGRRRNGEFYHQEATIFPVHNPSGKISNYVCIKRDVSDRKRTQTRLEHSLSLLHATFEATADGILVTDIRGKILHFNRKFVDLWQIPESVLRERKHRQVMDFIEAQLKNPRNLSIKKILELYIRPYLERYEALELQDGRTLEWYSCPQRLDDVVIGWVWSFRDITERQRTEARIRHQALHDSLTGLPNRILFNERLTDALARADRSKTPLAVIFLDLDRFKLINDTLGHAAGDRLLQDVAERLIRSVRPEDTVARWAGDEFTLLLPNLFNPEDALAVAQRILDAMKPEILLEGHPVHVSSSLGIAIYPTDGADAETLVKNADAALYRAKEAGRNGFHRYMPALNTEASEKLHLESQLHRALERQEFSLVYQPRVNVVTGRITHMEALIRWNHPTMGMVPPSKFIPIAEESGLILPLGEWVLRTACAQNRLWQLEGLLPVCMAVNLSPQQFRQAQLVERIGQVLQETALDPQYLELEITETAVMQNVELTQQILMDLHHQGVTIALDDFGTGYSSLSYLKEFPLQTLKIDQSFVRNVSTDANNRAIVAAIIAMGRVLNLRLVAEGVETEGQEHLLRSLGCQEMQGFRFSRPLSSEAAAALLHAGIPDPITYPMIA